MEKKILIAADDSINSKNAIHYAVGMASLIRDLKYTLFHVQPFISQFLVDEAKTSMKAYTGLQKLKKKNVENARAMLEEYRKEMITSGVPAENIEIRTQSRKVGLARDIIDYAQEGRYDALVVGRRGFSKVQELLMGSLTAKLVEHSQLIPLWMVDGNVTSRRILILVDGSESALRAVDHVSFILRHNPDVTVTLLHVLPRLKDYCSLDIEEPDEELTYLITQGARNCIDNFMAHVYKKFTSEGISRDQIELREVKKTFSVGRTIMEEMENGDFGTVVVGRRGVDRSFFRGSVSNYILSRTSERAIWLIS